MSESADIPQNQTPQELSTGREDTLARASRTLNSAVSLSRGAAIVNVGESSLPVDLKTRRWWSEAHKA